MKKGIDLKVIQQETKKLKVFEQLEKRLGGKDVQFNLLLEAQFKLTMMKDMRERFESSPATTSGGIVYGGQYWRKLSDGYLLSRPDRALGQIYIDTGQLRDSLTKPNPMMVSRIYENSYEFGTRIPYAEKLQEMRPIIFWHTKLLEKLAKVYLQYLINLDNKIIGNL